KVLVVIGPHVPELAPICKAAGASCLALSCETSDMRETVTLGLQWLKETYHPASTDAWFLVPADHPTLDPEVIQQLINAHVGQPHSSVFVPTCEGLRGHPPLISWTHCEAILHMPSGWGLNRYLREQARETYEIAMRSESILLDLDTPEDYDRLLKQW